MPDISPSEKFNSTSGSCDLTKNIGQAGFGMDKSLFSDNMFMDSRIFEYFHNTEKSIMSMRCQSRHLAFQIVPKTS